MSGKSEKRERAPNFTAQEKSIFLDIVHRYKNIIENKKTDQVNLEQKKEAWKAISNDFNAQNLHVSRKWGQLKTLYEHTKHDAKKEKAADRVQTYLTGGGKKQTKISEISEKALAIIEEQITSNKNNYDSSAQFYDNFLENDNAGTSSKSIQNNEHISDIVYSEQDDTVVVEEFLCDDDFPTPKKSPVKPKNVENAKQAQPFFAKRQRPALRTVYNSIDNVLKENSNKRHKIIDYEKELLEMRKEKHLLEMKLLKQDAELNETLKKEKQALEAKLLEQKISNEKLANKNLELQGKLFAHQLEKY